MNFIISYAHGTKKLVDKKRLCDELSTFNTYNMNIGTKPMALKWPSVAVHHSNKEDEVCRIEWSGFRRKGVEQHHVFLVCCGKDAVAEFVIEVS